MSKAKNDLFASASPDPWKKNANNIWLATSIRFFRNVERFKFPAKLEAAQRKQLLDAVHKELTANTAITKPDFCTGAQLGPLGKEFLLERFMLTEGLHQAGEEEGFLVDGKGRLLAIINISNHLQLQLMDYGETIEDSLNQLIAIESSLNDQLGFAFSQKFGYLTANPLRCGCALDVTAYLHLPALIHTEQLEPLRSKYEESGMTGTSMHGDPTKLLGDVLAIRNSQTLGVNEEQVISSIRSWATKLMIAEQTARKALLEEEDPHLKDMVSRAYGLLTSSYQLETFEALEALSLIKLGVDLKWVKGLTIADANHLFFSTRRAHLTSIIDKVNDEDLDLLRERAEFVHKGLKKAKLAL